MRTNYYNNKISRALADFLAKHPAYYAIPMEEWNVSWVNDMSYWFADMGNLPDISRWDTSSVMNMDYMFGGFRGELPDNSRRNTSNVKSMSGIFQSTEFKKINVNNWDTRNVTDISFAFRYSMRVRTLVLNN